MHPEAVNLLINKNANTKIKNKKGKTVLDVAKDLNRKKIELRLSAVKNEAVQKESKIAEQNGKQGSLDVVEKFPNVKTEKGIKTVTIGSQKWMAENLSVSVFRNGDIIPEAKTTTEWLAAYKSESPAWCYYNNDPKNGKKYGKLYNWYAASDSRGLAPEGWHIPTDKEWQALVLASGGSGVAFAKLKTSGGFAALPAGARYYKNASFNHMGKITFWWTASKNDKWNAWYHAMHFGYQKVDRDNGGMNTGHSVRCVMDK